MHGYPAMDVSAIANGHTAYDDRLVFVENRLYTLMVVDGVDAMTVRTLRGSSTP